MKKRIAIADVRPGMFIEADVDSERMGDAMAHFLVPRYGVYGERTNKRVRLVRRRYQRVAHDGGLLLGANAHVAALRATGLAAVVIDTAKGIEPGTELAVEKAPAAAEGAGAPTAQARRIEQSDDVGYFLHVTADADDLQDATPLYTPPEVRQDRLHFGPSSRGWMRVDVARDGRHAVLRVLSFGGDRTLGIDDVMLALSDHYGLKSGFDDRLIRLLVAQATAAPTQVLRGKFGIAEADEHSTIGDLRLTFVESRAGARPTFADLRTALAMDSLDDVLAQDPLTRAVMPGEELAGVKEERARRSLFDIFGHLRGEEAMPVAAGENVRVDGIAYLAESFGYVCVLDDLAVLSPVWISPDGVEAYFQALASGCVVPH